jgi:hypothetical protein
MGWELWGKVNTLDWQRLIASLMYSPFPIVPIPLYLGCYTKIENEEIRRVISKLSHLHLRRY